MALDLDVTFTSRATPTLRLSAAELTSGSSGPAPWWRRALERLLRPKLALRHPFGSWTWAPRGDPGWSVWPLVLVLLPLGTVGLAVYGAAKLLRRRRK